MTSGCDVDFEKDRIRVLYSKTHPNHNGVTIAMLYDLQTILEEEFDLFSKTKTALEMHVSPIDVFTSKMIIKKGISYAGFEMKCFSHYFTRREAFTFSKDGRVYFCGWASSENHKPFLEAMEKWILKHKRFEVLL